MKDVIGYLVYIPDKFDIKEYVNYIRKNNSFKYLNMLEELEVYVSPGVYTKIVVDLDEYSEAVVDLFGMLENGMILTEVSAEDDFERSVYNELIEIIQDNDLIVDKIDIRSDGGCILTVSKKLYEEKKSIDEWINEN